MPWVLAKDETMKDRLATVLYNLVEGIRIGTVLLRAFMPETSDKIFYQINTELKEFDTINEFGVSDEDAASQVSTISTIDGCPVWAIFMEYPQEIRIRLRSRGPVINKLAEEYNGGGHAKASGARLNSWEELDGFIQKADKLVKAYKEELNN